MNDKKILKKVTKNNTEEKRREKSENFVGGDGREKGRRRSEKRQQAPTLPHHPSSAKVNDISQVLQMDEEKKRNTGVKNVGALR